LELRWWVAGSSLVFTPNQELLNQYKIPLLDFQTQLSAYTGGVTLGINANQPIPSPSQAAMTAGIQVGQTQEGEQMRRIEMRFADMNSNDLEHIKQQLIFLPDGSTRPLTFFSDVKIVQGKTGQSRENLKSCAVLTARLDNRDLRSAIAEIKQQLNSKLALPKGYSIVYGGAYSEQQQSFQELMTAIGAILALMHLALGIGLGAQMLQPLAVAVIGGFVVGLPML
jgi:Cu/Ag efflux pump CusA